MADHFQRLLPKRQKFQAFLSQFKIEKALRRPPQWWNDLQTHPYCTYLQTSPTQTCNLPFISTSKLPCTSHLCGSPFSHDFPSTPATSGLSFSHDLPPQRWRTAHSRESFRQKGLVEGVPWKRQMSGFGGGGESGKGSDRSVAVERYTDARGYEHFRRASWDWDIRWTVAAGAGVVTLGVWVYTSNVQTIPYTHRRHFVIISPDLERALGASAKEDLKASFGPAMLPENHHLTVRVRHIAGKIVRAAMEGASASNWGTAEDVRQGGILPASSAPNSPRSRSLSSAGGELPAVYHDHAHDHNSDENHDEHLEDKFLTESRQRGLAKGSQGYTKHLEKLQWEVIVVDNKTANAFVLPSGTIVVFTGLLHHFRTDPEVAAILGHEVGHVVARHGAEALTNMAWIVVLQLVLMQIFAVPGLISDLSEVLLRLPNSRRAESEADRIGLMLMAAAGYDPRVAVNVHEKLYSLGPEVPEYLSTHPSGKNRSKALANSETLLEALDIYREKAAGLQHEGFL